MGMQSIKEILKVYRSGYRRARKMRFSSVEKQDVYNITAPFKLGRRSYILGRVEPRDIEEGARTVFFRKKGSYWVPDNSCPSFVLEDPFITRIKNMFVFSGVEVKQNPRRQGFLTYRTIFFKGHDIHSLKQFAVGPWGMKGIRLVELPDGRIGVFTRPQGKKGRRGQIGFAIIASFQSITPRFLHKVELIPARFVKGEWGGVNEAYVLSNGKIGVLGHIARYSKDIRNRFYYPMVFCLDIETMKTSSIRVLVRRAELPEGEAKRPDLYNVVYPGGIVRDFHGGAVLYAGVGDAEAYEILIDDPFLFYESGGGF